MPFSEEEKTPTPSPWGWPPAGEKQCPQGRQIVYNDHSTKRKHRTERQTL